MKKPLIFAVLNFLCVVWMLYFIAAGVANPVTWIALVLSLVMTFVNSAKFLEALNHNRKAKALQEQLNKNTQG